MTNAASTVPASCTEASTVAASTSNEVSSFVVPLPPQATNTAGNAAEAAATKAKRTERCMLPPKGRVPSVGEPPRPTSGYPTDIITKIYDDIEGLGANKPPFVVGTGDYQNSILKRGFLGGNARSRDRERDPGVSRRALT